MNSDSQNRLLGFVYAATIFLSAFLLFQVQPLVSKYILPWFGGTPAVWTTCMLFFQVLLFAGYGYAHLTTKRSTERTQAIAHIGLVLLAVGLLPITPDSGWKPTGNEQPTLQIVMLLAVSVGLPFFILSSTGPLLQGWFSRTHRESSPYRLYALSNLGSLLALVSYPFAFEPAFATRMQAEIWSWGFRSFAGFVAVCALWMWRCTSKSPRTAVPQRDSETADAVAPTLGVRCLWFALPMGASVMLLATTNQVCMDVASVPFLWVLPLTLYLLSFILCFDSDRWYSRRLFALAFAISMASVSAIMLKGAGVSIIAQVLIYFMGLFFCSMLCHGELVRLKPHPRYLTSFYLVIAAGGAAGGLFVGLIAPAVFTAYLELHLGILGCCVLTLTIFFRDRRRVLHAGRPRWAWAAMILAVVAIAAALRIQASETVEGTVSVSRNFYGVLRIKEEHRNDPEQRQLKLMHGRILHGLQFISQKKRSQPTAYYGRDSGVGRVLSTDQTKRVGVVGLGVGTIAAYAKPGDYYRFYEINPDVIRLANQYFTYLSQCRADVDVVVGDGRLSLEREQPQHFDVLVLDAFSGDAIPTHLLTIEAFRTYLRHLEPDGLLAVHISNLHFDLRPVVSALAENCGLSSLTVLSKRNDLLGTNTCMWMLASFDPSRLEIESFRQASVPSDDRRFLWTDDRRNLFQILR